MSSTYSYTLLRKAIRDEAIILKSCVACGFGFLLEKFEGDGAAPAFLVCQLCGLGTYNGLPTEFDLTQHYNDSYGHYLESDYAAMDLEAKDLIEAAARFRDHCVRFGLKDRSPLKILDFGSSFPLFGLALQDLGHGITIVEPNSRACEYGESRGLAAYANLKSLPKIRKFDVIRMSHSLEHVRDPLKTLSQARARVAPEGLLCVSAPNWDSWQARVMGKNWEWYSFPDHLWHFTPLSLQLLLKKAGFDVVEIETTSASQGFREILSIVDGPDLERAVVRSLKGQNLTVWGRRSN